MRLSTARQFAAHFLTWQFVRFIAVGVMNTAVGLLTIYAIKWLAPWVNDFAANFAGYVVGLTNSLTFNARWTFAHRGGLTNVAGRFAIVIAIAYLANLAVLALALHVFSINSYLAHAIATVPYTAISFLGMRLYVFRQHQGTVAG